jgi:pilus assembly protein CpaE
MGKILRAMQMHFDLIVIDGPAEYSDQVLAAFDASDLVTIIAGLDVVGIRHLAKAMETLTSIGIPKNKLRVIVNRADSKVGLTVADVERVTGIKVDGGIPSSRMVPTALNKGVPVYLDEPGSDVAKSIKKLAEELSYSLLKRPAAAAAGDPKKRRLFSKSR